MFYEENDYRFLQIFALGILDIIILDIKVYKAYCMSFRYGSRKNIARFRYGSP